jgi:hypothetical protein
LGCADCFGGVRRNIGDERAASLIARNEFFFVELAVKR